jgi:hypothetical protein
MHSRGLALMKAGARPHAALAFAHRHKSRGCGQEALESHVEAIWVRTFDRAARLQNGGAVKAL